MIGNQPIEKWLEDLQKICPQFVKVFCEQTQNVQKKIVELIAEQHSFVLKEDYQRQKELYDQLIEKARYLEIKVDQILESKTASIDLHDV